MKQLILFLILFFAAGLKSQAGVPDSTLAKVDTVAVTMMYSVCEICDPRTTPGFILLTNKGTEEKPNYKQLGYLYYDKKPLQDNVIVWMVNRKQDKK